jgi:hypothetical protein
LNNEIQEHHVMVLEGVHPTGAEEWYCPTCGRRIMMQWPPNYKKIVLEAGDEYAVHSGGKGGLQVNEFTAKSDNSVEEVTNSKNEIIAPVEGNVLTEEDMLRLVSWEEWLEKIDLDSRWNN